VGFQAGKLQRGGYELRNPFRPSKNQLSAVKIPAKPGISDIKRAILFPGLADFLFNTNTPSRASERFFKQISFHAKFTSVTAFEARESHKSLTAFRRRRKCLCSLTTFREKA